MLVRSWIIECIEHVGRFYFVFIHFLVHLTQDNIEIENKEEADFLKSKLCDLLKEFKAKKSFNAEVSITLRVITFIYFPSACKIEANEEPAFYLL